MNFDKDKFNYSTLAGEESKTNNATPCPITEADEIAKEQSLSVNRSHKLKLAEDILDEFEESPSQLDIYVEYLGSCIADILANDNVIDISSFGKFSIKKYRPVVSPPVGDHTFVEAPYFGPIEFKPYQSLLRQINEKKIDRAITARSDILYALLRNYPSIPKGMPSVLIKETFLAIAVALIENTWVELPCVGTFFVRPKPAVLHFTPNTHEIRQIVRNKAIVFKPYESLLNRVSGIFKIPVVNYMLQPERKALAAEALPEDIIVDDLATYTENIVVDNNEPSPAALSIQMTLQETLSSVLEKLPESSKNI